MERGGGNQRGGRTSEGADLFNQRHSEVGGQHIVTLGNECVGQFSTMPIIHNLGSIRVHTENDSVRGNFTTGRGRGVLGMRGGRTTEFRGRSGNHREQVRSEFQVSGRGDFNVHGNFGVLNNSEVEGEGNLGRQRTNYSEARAGGSHGQQEPDIHIVEAVQFNTCPSQDLGNITVTTGITPEGRRFLQLCQAEELAKYEDGLAKTTQLTEEAGTSSRGLQQYCSVQTAAEAEQNAPAQAREDDRTHREVQGPGNSEIRGEGQEYEYVDLGEDEEFGNPLPNLNFN